MRRNTAGTDLKNRVILAALERWPARLRLWPQNTGAVKIGDQLVTFGVAGTADILGIAGPGGRFVAIEIKAGDDRMGEKQAAFREMILRFGGIHIIGRSVDQVLADLGSELR
jgi:hypothetical protein